MKTKILGKWLSLLLCLVIIACSVIGVLGAPVTAADTGKPWGEYLVRTFTDDSGRQIDQVIFPGKPPEVKAEVVQLPEVMTSGVTNALSNVPAFDWSYGCSATSAAMTAGYYDRIAWANVYTGPTNGGVCPLDNSVWPPGIGGSAGECPLSATHDGIDDRTSRGHVDDYWIAYGNTGPDPYIVNSWAEHSADCLGDFMGTNQSKYGNTDGGTTFYFNTDGSPLYDYTGAEPTYRDGCHGLRLFFESLGYSVQTNFSQYILGKAPSPLDPDIGFTFANFQQEIDAGRPVLIQVEGHTMLGIGYDAPTSSIYVHDTWDYSTHLMTWGGTYQGLQQYGVTVLRLNLNPGYTFSAPSAISLGSMAPGSTATATSSDGTLVGDNAAGYTVTGVDVKTDNKGYMVSGVNVLHNKLEIGPSASPTPPLTFGPADTARTFLSTSSAGIVALSLYVSQVVAYNDVVATGYTITITFTVIAK